LSVFLLILKIIGIVLLSIIGIVLFAVLLVLFVPIRYRVDADYHEKVIAHAKVSWLLHILSFVVSYDENGLGTVLRIFGIKFKRRDRKPKKVKAEKTKTKKDKKNKNQEMKAEISADSKTDQKADSQIPGEGDYTLEGFEEEPPKEEEPVKEAKTADTSAEADSSEAENSFFAKLKEYIGKLRSVCRNFSRSWKRFTRKVSKAYEQYNYYLDLLTDSHVQEVLLDALAIVLKAIGRILPRKIKGNLHFGLEDSESMGKALAILGMLYPLYYGKIKVEPEYDTKVLEGDIVIKGRIFVISLLISGWKLYFNKELRKVISALKKEGKK